MRLQYLWYCGLAVSLRVVSYPRQWYLFGQESKGFGFSELSYLLAEATGSGQELCPAPAISLVDKQECAPVPWRVGNGPVRPVALRQWRDRAAFWEDSWSI